MTPEQFEKKLRQLEKRVCCLSQQTGCDEPALVDRTGLGVDDTQTNTIQFDTDICTAWFIAPDGTNNTIIDCSSSCTYTIDFNINNQGFTLSSIIRSVDFSDTIEVTSNTNSSIGIGIVQFSGIDDVEIVITAGSSIFSYTVTVQEDSNEIINESEFGLGGEQRIFTFTPQCGSNYNIVIQTTVTA